jgi:phosphotransferase system enzyme I (PtsI)
VLQLISQSIAQARAAGKGVSVCGEMAGDPDFTELLLSMGLRSFSMHPSQIPAVKQRLLRSDAQRLASALPRLLESEDPRAVAEKELAAARGGAAVIH